MRVLPVAAALALSLVFTVGGVAIVGRADAPAPDRTPAASASSTPAPAPRASAPPQQCRVVQHPAHRPGQLRQMAHVDGFVLLNTRGYNYALPGELQFDPTARPTGKPGASAKPAAQTPVPAAPAK